MKFWGVNERRELRTQRRERSSAGATFPLNGLPVVTFYYRNDDGGPLYEKDSRLTFTAPADGDYLVCIRDVRGLAGERRARPRLSFCFRRQPTLLALSLSACKQRPGSGDEPWRARSKLKSALAWSQWPPTRTHRLDQTAEAETTQRFLLGVAPWSQPMEQQVLCRRVHRDHIAAAVELSNQASHPQNSSAAERGQNCAKVKVGLRALPQLYPALPVSSSSSGAEV